MTEVRNILYRQILADREHVTALRRRLHQHPELAREEFETQRIIEEELDALGVPHERIAGTGVLARIDGAAPSEAPRCIVLRADIDALPISEQSGADYQSLSPGRMHACGHDAHTAALLEAARALSLHRRLFSGRVLLSWQPGEEVGYGARVIVDSGAIDEASRSFGVHLAPEIDAGSLVLMEGPNNASVDWFRIRVRGLGSHVSAPEKGVDALYIASQIVVAVQSLVTRCTGPMDPTLIGIGRLEAGSAYNVVADRAELEGTIRAMSAETRAGTKARLEELARNTAALYGAACEIQWQDIASVLSNDPEATRQARRTAAALFGEDHVVCSRKPSLSGDDFAEYILRVPGVYAYIGSGNDADPRTRSGIHHSDFDIDESCLTVAAAMYACYSADYLNASEE